MKKGSAMCAAFFMSDDADRVEAAQAARFVSVGFDGSLSR
jgi:hypothetical protein